MRVTAKHFLQAQKELKRVVYSPGRSEGSLLTDEEVFPVPLKRVLSRSFRAR